MKWTKFYNFNEVLDIKPFAHKDGRATGWKCKFNGLEAKFATRDGCQLKQNNHLDNDDCGIYWLRANEICEDHPSKVWDYIGLSNSRTAAKYQRGIYGRLADHIRKIQHIPERPLFSVRMFQRDNPDFRIRRPEEIIKMLKETSGKKNKNITLYEEYVEELGDANFENCQEFRDLFADKDGKDYICSTAPFRDLFNSHKSLLKTFADIEKYLHENIKLRFFIIPKMKRESLYIELAEAISHQEYKQKFEGHIPKLCSDDESLKLAQNGELKKVKKRDPEFDLTKDTSYVQNEIGILNGFWDIE